VKRLAVFAILNLLLLACNQIQKNRVDSSEDLNTGTMQAREDPISGQLILVEAGRPILQYNYRIIQPGAVLEVVTKDNLIYARPRSDYIHPLYGLNGEELTLDWPVDHPHHRGIYWAWPEVKFGDEMGDLHALQKVFARPTGEFRLSSTAEYAEIEAENRWLWQEREPIVQELAVIRAHRTDIEGRIIDLAFYFTALQEGVSVTRRGTEHYGGLNVRLAQVADQKIEFHTDSPTSDPRMAWAQLSGIFSGSSSLTGISIFQHRANPDYPGDWVQYPELNWFQPTFPAAKSRYRIEKDETLLLRYRIWIHPDAAGVSEHILKWKDFNETPPM
jgi:hypothetical protein